MICIKAVPEPATYDIMCISLVNQGSFSSCCYSCRPDKQRGSQGQRRQQTISSPLRPSGYRFKTRFR